MAFEHKFMYSYPPLCSAIAPTLYCRFVYGPCLIFYCEILSLYCRNLQFYSDVFYGYRHVGGWCMWMHYAITFLKSNLNQLKPKVKESY